MEFAFNYSPVLAELVTGGQVRVDRFKCPAWPDLIRQAQQVRPVYIHFPLEIGFGRGTPIDSEKGQPADLERIAELMEMTGTPLVNTHLYFSGKTYPEIPLNSRDPRHLEQVVSAALRDLEPLIRRFGAERVTVETLINEFGWLDLSALPEVITRVLDETGCGFLFDLSHARLAARNLGLDERAYAASLPVERIREIHITGVQLVEGDLLDMLRAHAGSNGLAATFAGKYMDHLPMTGEDWPELAWMMEQIRGGSWREPWVIACEIGGVGGFWEQISTREFYLSQLPRMAEMVMD